MADKVPQVEEEVVVVPDLPPADKAPVIATVEAKEQPEHNDEKEPEKPKQEVETEMSNSNADDEEKVPLSGSFKEESTSIVDLPENEQKALQQLKQLVQEALNKHEFGGIAMLPQQTEKDNENEKKYEVKPAMEEEAITVAEESPKPETEKESVIETKDEREKEETINQIEAEDDDGAKTVEAIEETIVSVSSSVQTEQKPESEEVETEEKQSDAKTEDQISPEEVSIWGIPLLADERSDVILLKFLRARDFKVKDAFSMLKNTIRWRKEFCIDELIQHDMGDDLEKVVYMHGFDKEGHPVCYNVYGEFQNKELYQKTFSDEEKRQKFMKWRIQFLEKSIRKLDFSPGGISTIVQVNDLKNSPGPAKWELRQATKQALQLLQDNYPEFVARQVFINVPWWYLAVNKMISPFLTQRTRSKFVFAGPSKSADTLSRFIAAEQVPIKYGGLSKEDGEFANSDAVTEITVKAAAKHTVEFPVTEKCEVRWEVRVVGWDHVRYGAEFIPSNEDSYTVIIQKERKVECNEEQVVCNSFKMSDEGKGKIVLTIHNPTSKKKKLLYRFNTIPY